MIYGTGIGVRYPEPLLVACLHDIIPQLGIAYDDRVSDEGNAFISGHSPICCFIMIPAVLPVTVNKAGDNAI